MNNTALWKKYQQTKSRNCYNNTWHMRLIQTGRIGDILKAFPQQKKRDKKLLRII